MNNSGSQDCVSCVICGQPGAYESHEIVACVSVCLASNFFYYPSLFLLPLPSSFCRLELSLYSLLVGLLQCVGMVGNCGDSYDYLYVSGMCCFPDLNYVCCVVHCLIDGVYSFLERGLCDFLYFFIQYECFLYSWEYQRYTYKYLHYLCYFLINCMFGM